MTKDKRGRPLGKKAHFGIRQHEKKREKRVMVNRLTPATSEKNDLSITTRARTTASFRGASLDPNKQIEERWGKENEPNKSLSLRSRSCGGGILLNIMARAPQNFNREGICVGRPPRIQGQEEKKKGSTGTRPLPQPLGWAAVRRGSAKAATFQGADRGRAREREQSTTCIEMVDRE